MLTASTSITFETVTPEIAQELLNNPRPINRPISRERVLFWAEMMVKGNFDPNVMWIQIDWNGGLINGQHRLSAIIESNIPQRMWVQRGCDPAMIHKIDTGYKRTASNSIAMERFADANAVAGVIRAIHIISSNELKLKMHNQEIVEWAVLYREEIQSTVRAWRQVAAPYYSYWYAALGFIYTHRLNEADTAETIREVFKSGVPSRKGCPAHAAREWMAQHSRKAHRPTSWAVLEIATQTFEHMRQGESVKRYIMPMGWVTPTPYFKLRP